MAILIHAVETDDFVNEGERIYTTLEAASL